MNYLLVAAGYFIPVFRCCPISKQRYGYNDKYDIFDQGPLVGHIAIVVDFLVGDIRQHPSFPNK
ncbi:MAG: hypothetical protein ABIO81_09400 [Ginsengibacter sp.]